MELRVAAHYCVDECAAYDGMALLRKFFPKGKANALNFVLFSTSGIHGSYTTIEEEEQCQDKECRHDITFLIVMPRVVRLYYGNCIPKGKRDFNFLKKLRASSWEVMTQIGRD